MSNSYNSLKHQLIGLSRKDQYQILLMTDEWYFLREKILALDDNTCTHCARKGGWIEEEIMTLNEWITECENVRLHNKAVRKRYTKNPTEQIKQLLEGNPGDFKGEPSRFKIIGTVILQIHHKLYFWDKLPWEYDRKYLITLCKECHIKEHNTTTIYMYQNESMQSRIELSLCLKCGGDGYLPEYNHVLGGICFQCGGRGDTSFSDQPNWTPTLVR